MTGEKHDEALLFRPDFAARVLNAADTIAVRRRNLRWTAAAAFTPVLAGAAFFAAWQMRAVTAASEGRVVLEVASAGPGALTTFRSAQMGPLDFLFPDAGPLERFSDLYGESNNTLENDAVFFPDAADDSAIEVDGS